MRATWLIAIAVVISSYLGARQAVNRKLATPENAARIAATVTRHRVSDSVRAMEAYAGRLARERYALRLHKRMDMLCAKDWEMATDARERSYALDGYGPLVHAELGHDERGTCALGDDGKITWIAP